MSEYVHDQPETRREKEVELSDLEWKESRGMLSPEEKQRLIELQNQGDTLVQAAREQAEDDLVDKGTVVDGDDSPF